tara:strand:+ start:3252 stop:4781 length:1530 start_codon:yes stop_codon:yes gene_type:complete
VQTPILGSAYVARSVNAADSRMVNLFPEVVPEGGKQAAFLNRAPGLRRLATIGTGPIRGLWAPQITGSDGYVVSGQGMYKIDTSYNATFLGTIDGSGPVSIADNGTQIFIAANPNGYIYNMSTGAFAPIGDPDFPGASTVGYLDGYFVFNEPDSQRIWVTSLLDGTSVDPLDFASAEGAPDQLISVNIDHREAWLFGTGTTEVWYNAGTADFPLQRIQGAFNELGCAAVYSVAKLDNTLFWLGSDARGRGIVYQANGYRGERISTHAVEFAIQNYSTISDAVAYSYQQEGHKFYVLSFPTANATWVYDTITGAWHERAGLTNGVFTRHRANCQMNFNNQTIVGDYEDGRIYAFDLDVYADDDRVQKWLRSWRALPTGQNNLRRTAHHTLQLDCQSGVGTGANIDADFALDDELGIEFITEDDATLLLDETLIAGPYPQAILRWSDDAGHTWSREHWTSLGAIGRYGQRVFWRRLGMTLKLRDRVYEVSGTDPTKIVIMGAELILDGTSS